MNSIFIGSPETIARVYPVEIRQALEKEAGLDPDRVITPAQLTAAAVPLSEVSYAFGTWGFPAVTETEIRSVLPNLKAVFYAAGSVQHFARPFFKCGVRLFSAWGANAVPVAEYAGAQILLANKGFFQTAQRYGSGGPQALADWRITYPGNYRCRVGIIGAGMIGTLLIHLLKQYQLEILVYDPFLPDTAAQDLGVRKASLQELFAGCTTISNHLANNPQTAGILDYRLFSSMQPGAVFINTGRGAQVNEPDLCRLLQERPDITAVLDVTDPEPPKPGHPFYCLPNVILTPHIAGSLGHEVERMALYMLEEFRCLQSGAQCRFEVTEEMLKTMA